MEEDIAVGAAALTPAPAKPRRSIKTAKQRARHLVAEAGKLQKGERLCKGHVKLRPDMSRAVGSDNPYLLNADGSVQTRPCRNSAIQGGLVCRKHGGSAPQVKAKAERRLRAMIDPSLTRLEELMLQDEHLPTALGATLSIQNRVLGAIGKDASEKEAVRPIVIGIQVGGVPMTAQPRIATAVVDVQGEVVDDAE